LIAVLALLFTVFSFWWLNARRGRLRMTEVRLFACYVGGNGGRLRLPIALHNTGAVPLVVVDLRIRAESRGLERMAATRTHRTTIRPGADDVEDFPRPYEVPGRAVVTKFVEFTMAPELMLTLQPLNVDVEALIDRRGWRRVGRSTVRTDTVADPDVYITYSNDPAHWPNGQKQKASLALSRVRAELGMPPIANP
jgi:hypothetical protein